MDSGELLSYLTTAKISDGSWRGTTKRVILNWIVKLCSYHKWTTVADLLSENTQRTLLQNAVSQMNLDYTKHCVMQSGSYVQANHESTKTSSNVTRTLNAIYLRPAQNQ
jgi:hypothetical protein